MPSSKQTKTVWFTPERRASSTAAKALVRDVISQVEEKEQRKRKRRAPDQVTFELSVEAVITDLTYRHLEDREKRLCITRSKSILGTASRYRSPVMRESLLSLLDTLSSPEHAFIEQIKGQAESMAAIFFSDDGKAVPEEMQARVTTLKAGERLITLIKESCLRLSDLTIAPPQELIERRRKETASYRAQACHGNKKRLPYDDDETTCLYRRQLETINQWIVDANIYFDNSRLSEDKECSNRHLRRTFSRGDFTSGGRLVGGFWQSLSKQERRDGLSINNESITTLDYSQLTPRILYGMVEAEPTTEDAYIIPGYENHRAGIKKTFNAMVFSNEILTKRVRGTKELLPKYVQLTKADSSPIAQIIRLLKENHPAISDMFFRGLGHDAQFIESQIMVDVLLQLKDRGIVGLPVHDAVIISESDIDITRQIMIDTFKKHAGVDIIVEEE